MISNAALLEVAKKLSYAVGAAVRDSARQVSLGGDLGVIGCGGDRSKIGDASAVNAAKEFLASHSEKLGGVLIDEETGVCRFGAKDCTESIFIILDPIDGSNNMRPFPTPAPFISTSVAIGRLSRVDAGTLDAVDIGVVLDIFNNRLFSAIRKEGAQCEGYGRMSGSSICEIKDAIIGIDLDQTGTQLDETLERVHRVLRATKCQRRLGSSILDFMKVACGEYDAFLSSTFRMKLYDISAAKLIVEEAGGVFEVTPKLEGCEKLLKRIIDDGANDLLRTNTFSVTACGNPVLHDTLQAI